RSGSHRGSGRRCGRSAPPRSATGAPSAWRSPLPHDAARGRCAQSSRRWRSLPSCSRPLAGGRARGVDVASGGLPVLYREEVARTEIAAAAIEATLVIEQKHIEGDARLRVVGITDVRLGADRLPAIIE